jgi:hypothetical protein
MGEGMLRRDLRFALASFGDKGGGFLVAGIAGIFYLVSLAAFLEEDCSRGSGGFLALEGTTGRSVLRTISPRRQTKLTQTDQSSLISKFQRTGLFNALIGRTTYTYDLNYNPPASKDFGTVSLFTMSTVRRNLLDRKTG